MDRHKFDMLARGFGMRRNRRDGLKFLAAGLLGLRQVAGVSAQVTVELAACGDKCLRDDDCNAGLRCNGEGKCVAISDSRKSCRQNVDCDRDFEICRDGRCVNQVDCSRCDRDRDCGRNEICRNNRCERSECNDNNDCRRSEKCRRHRCIPRG